MELAMRLGHSYGTSVGGSGDVFGLAIVAFIGWLIWKARHRKPKDPG